jgi:nucleoside triphosphate diphosphatase
MPVERLLEIMATLRDPGGGCPWDLEQTNASIAPHTIEEAYEVDDAIRRGDWDGLRDELGDLLLQVAFHAQIAREAGRFDFADVVGAICDKLVRRHPHVFGDAVIDSASAQTEAWEKQKADERAARGETSAVDGVPLSLPSLLRARKLLSRAVRAGFAASEERDAVATVTAKLAEVKAGEGVEARLGDLLLAVVALSAERGVEPEEALRGATAALEARIRDLERP